MSVKAAQVTVDNTADLLASSDVGGQQVIIRNAGAAAVFIGPSTVSTANGYELSANGGTVDIVLGQNEEIYGICATSSRVDVLRIAAD